MSDLGSNSGEEAVNSVNSDTGSTISWAATVAEFSELRCWMAAEQEHVAQDTQIFMHDCKWTKLWRNLVWGKFSLGYTTYMEKAKVAVRQTLMYP